MQLHHLDRSFLATYRPARIRFRDSEELSPAVRSVWEALRTQENRRALRRGYERLRGVDLTLNDRAALLAAMATAEWDNGVSTTARRMALESIALYETQWLAHRVLLSIDLSERRYEAARDLLERLELDAGTAAWDEPLSRTEQHILRAACAWMTNAWDETALHLNEAYPEGVRSMPLVLQEDWFRLAFYRNRPLDAADAAGELLGEHAPEKADILIQTLVRQGWHREALALYRRIYEADPSNELLRRRVVGLCIREGNVQEARRLMELGALRLAV